MRPNKSRVILYIFLIFIAFIFLLPLWSDITTSLKPLPEVAQGRPLIFPTSPTLEAFHTAFHDLGRPILNSFMFTVPAVILQSFLGSMAGYVFAKHKFRGSNGVFLLIILGAFIPYQAILIPLLRTIAELGLYNSIGGLILTHTAFGIPLCVLLFRIFYEYIPDSLIKSAKVDGAGTWAIYRHVVLPLSILPFAVVGVLAFTGVWNDYLFGLVLTRGPDAMPATVALANLKGTYAGLWNVQMAGALFVALPVLIIYIVSGKYIMRGYMAGAVRG